MRFSVKYTVLAILFGAVLASAAPLPVSGHSSPAPSRPGSPVQVHEPTIQELQTAAHTTLTDMKELDSCKGAKVALIGGQAIIHYIGRSRTTKDVDILTTAKGAPKMVKTELLKKFHDRYRQESDIFEVKVGTNWVEVDMVPASQYGPDVPAVTGLKDLTALGSGTLPWASVSDLIVTKMFAKPIRAQKEKKAIDLSDIAVLAAYGHDKKVQYTDPQRIWVEKEIKDAEFETVAAALKTMFNIA